ncbi:MAG: hypothetical protein WAQ98_04330 [Blastocatellia bacterium]
MSKFKGGLEAYKQRQSNTLVLPDSNTSDSSDSITDNESNESNETNESKDNIKKSVSSNDNEISNNEKLTANETKIINRKASSTYQQVNTYVPKQLYKQVKILLIEQERGISDLITELLNNWVEQNKSR